MSREVSWHMPNHQIAITDKTIDVWECMVRLIAAPLQFSGFTFLTLTIYLGPAVSHEVIPPTAGLRLRLDKALSVPSWSFYCAL